MSEPTPTASAPEPRPATQPEQDPPAGPSKSELKKRAKEAEKAKKAAEREAREAEERKKREAADAMDEAKQNYGKLPMHQSAERNGMSPFLVPARVLGCETSNGKPGIPLGR